jgi:hypothetical protein
VIGTDRGTSSGSQPGTAKPRSERFLICETLDAAIRFAFQLLDSDVIMLRHSQLGLLAPAAHNVADGAQYFLEIRRLAPAAMSPAPSSQAAGSILAPSHSSSSSGSGPRGKLAPAHAAAEDAQVPQLPDWPEFPDGKGPWKAEVPGQFKDDFNHTGWATISIKSRPGDRHDSSYRKCIGVLHCTAAGCKFTIRPVVRKSKRAQQIAAARCKEHSSAPVSRDVKSN